jgi:hypothetical protein
MSVRGLLFTGLTQLAHIFVSRVNSQQSSIPRFLDFGMRDFGQFLRKKYDTCVSPNLVETFRTRNVSTASGCCLRPNKALGADL